MAKRSKKKKASPQLPPRKPTSLPKPNETGKILSSKPATISWPVLLQAAVIIAAGVWIYWPALHGDWLWDDALLVTDNSKLHTYQGLWNIWLSPETDWPLTWTLLWIEWHLWGNAPLGYHVCSLALHLSSGLLLWRLFGRLGLRFGWLGGLLFVVHPLVVESVAWIAEIKNTLSLPLFLLSCDAWLDAEEKRSTGYARSVLYYLAAMLAKTSTVMLPSVLLLYCWWKRGRIARQEITRMFPYAAIAMVLGLITVYFQTHGQDKNLFVYEGFFTHLIGAGTALFFYLGKFILPVHLLPIYPRWTLDPPSLLEMLTLPALTALLFAFWTQRRSWGRPALFGFGFFLLNVLPVLGLVTMRYMSVSWVADHLAYLPMIGLIGLVIAGVGQLHDRVPSSLQLCGIAGVSMMMTWLTWQSHNYASLFINEETLWTYTLQYNSQAWPAYNNLGVAEARTGRVPEAMEQFEQALRINPNDAEAHNNLGNALMQTGRTREAMEQFETAVKINPDMVEFHNDLGYALCQSGRVQEAIEQYEQALRIEPDYADGHYNLGIALVQAGRLPEAIEQYEQALKFRPDYADAYINLGEALLQTGRVPEAIAQFEQALNIKPDSADARYNLGNALVQAGHIPEAIEQYELALKLKPEYADAHANLGNALLQTGHLPEAIEQYEQALKLKPGYADAHSNLGIALLHSGRVAEAIDQYEQALRINPDHADVHYNLGNALFQAGRESEAIGQYEQALKILPDFKQARDNLAKVQALQKAGPAKR